MDDNRYAPPKSEVEGAPAHARDAPALWNPSVAGNWALLLTPVFGAWVHMLNWRALGEPQRAESAKTWVLFSALILIGLSTGAELLPGTDLRVVSWLAYPVMLVAWWYASGRAQARWVADRFDGDYPRRSWWQPLLGAGVMVVFLSMATSLVIGVGSQWIPR